MTQRRRSVSIGLLALGVLTSSAVAAKPKTAECLAASEASFKSASAHQLRSERSQLLVCAAASCPGDIQKECLRRVEEVNRAIPSIIFVARDGDGNDLSAVKVTMDGEILAERLEGTALAIDPGEHRFTFETSGQPTLEKKILIHEAEKERREVIVIGAPTVAAAPPAAEPAQAAPPSAPPEPASDRSSGLGTQRAVALVAGGVGVAGVIVGTLFGLQSKSKHDKANDVCSGDVCQTSDGIADSNDSVKKGNVSTVAFIVGAAGLAGGAVLWFTAKPSESSGAQVGLSLGGVQVRGSW